MILEDGTCDVSIPAAGSSGSDQELFDKYGKAPLLLGWHEIRQLLFDHLPGGIVHFDTQVTACLSSTKLVSRYGRMSAHAVRMHIHLCSDHMQPADVNPAACLHRTLLDALSTTRAMQTS